MLQEKIVSQLRKYEVPYEKFVVGAKFQHLLLNQDLTAVSYDEEKGIADLLEYLMRTNDWEGIYEGDYIIGAKKDNMTIMLKLGGQIEWAIAPTARLQEIDRAYLDFIQSVMPELSSRGQILISVGAQPKTAAKDIQVVPMALNEALLANLKDDEAAVELLKTSAKSVVTLSYAHSDDFEKKLNVVQLISPVLTAIFDNVPLKEGAETAEHCANQRLINQAKSSLFREARAVAKDVFKYKDYASYAANMPVVAVADGEGLMAKEGLAVSVYNGENISEEEAEAVLNMVQSDIKITPQGIEVSMVDSLPYPLNMAYVALLKGIFNHKEHMDDIVDSFKELTEIQLMELKRSICTEGLDAKFGEGTLLDYAKDLYFMVMPTMEPLEQHYIQPLDMVLFKGAIPKKVLARQLMK